MFLITTTTVNAQESGLSRISVAGNQLVTADGEKILLRGLNTSDPDHLAAQRHWNRAYFEEMKSWGANVVRFPVHPTRWNRRGPQEYLELLDQGIAYVSHPYPQK